MKRGDLYLVAHPTDDPRPRRVMVVVSRQLLLDSRRATVVCAPIRSAYRGLETEVPVGPEEGLKFESAIHCDNLQSVAKTRLTHYVGRLPNAKIDQLDSALRAALGIDHDGMR